MRRPPWQSEGLTASTTSSHILPPAPGRYQAFDLLATLVAVVATDGTVLYANAALEDALGSSRRTIEGSSFPQAFTEPRLLRTALEGAGSNEFATLRYDAWLIRHGMEALQVHVVVAQTDQPGEVVIELLPLEQQARQVTFGRQRYRLALELHVIDNGPGVPPSIKDRIFYPLVSGRDGGSGLGLTLAQTFVQQHHGLVECDSVPGRTDFKILIPLP